MVVNRQEVSRNGKLIALIEDDARLVDMFRDVLKSAGYGRLHIFSDGKDAKDRLPELGADLILLDVGLPNLDGVSLYKILRGHSNTKHIPIIVITGSHDWELHRMGLQTGLLLRKPFSVQELLMLIRALLPEVQEG
ncbi:MAG: response regulator [Ktedonobacteraceae bacterium]|nr:response regulator [Chloroflexota bacterium]